MKLPGCWKVISCLLLVAVCGGIIGAAAAIRMQNRRMAAQTGFAGLSARAANRYIEYLQLSSEQREQIQPILEQSQQEIRAIATNALAQAAQVQLRLSEQVRPILTPGQSQRLEELERRREHWREMLRERWQSGERTLSLPPPQRERIRERIRERFLEKTNNAEAQKQPK